MRKDALTYDLIDLGHFGLQDRHCIADRGLLRRVGHGRGSERLGGKGAQLLGLNGASCELRKHPFIIIILQI